MNIEDINFVRQGLRFIVLIQKDLPCESLMPNSIQCWLFFFYFLSVMCAKYCLFKWMVKAEKKNH